MSSAISFFVFFIYSQKFSSFFLSDNLEKRDQEFSIAEIEQKVMGIS